MIATSYEGFLQLCLIFIAIVSAPGLGGIIYSLKKKKRSVIFLSGSLVSFGIGFWLVWEAIQYRQHDDGMLQVYFVLPFIPLLCGLLGVAFCLWQKITTS